jgi:glucosamine-6-phosphate deaminase
MDAVPREALTLPCPGLFRAQSWICSVPEARKAKAVRCALEGPVSTVCPGSLVRTHPNATVYLDIHSSALLASVPPKAR